MRANSEKRDAAVVEASAGIHQLKLDAEQNAIILTQYQREFVDSMLPFNDVDTKYSFRNILLFIANAPKKVLRVFSKRLQRITRRLLRTIHESKWRLPRFLVGDAIRFEDALGRQHRLPFQYFRHWAMLKHYLVYSFDGLPGCYQVRRDQYCLFAGSFKNVITGRSWEEKVKPGERVSMAVVTTKPSTHERQLKCPSCSSVLPLGGELTGSVICSHCNLAFKTSQGSRFHHVKPSDGGKHMLISARQRMLLSFHEQNKHGQTRSGGNTSWHQAHEADDVRCLPSPETNLGYSQLKKIILHSTHNPIEVADTIEDLLNQLFTIANHNYLTEQRRILRLRHALALIREEACLVRDLSYLDFKNEHRDFMDHARSLIKSLETLLDDINTGNQPTSNPDYGRLFSSWVLNHYVQPRSDCSDTTTTTTTTTTTSNTTLILMKTLIGNLVFFRATPSTTILHLKLHLQSSQGYPVTQQYLVCRGRKLEDHRTVGSYDLSPRYYVHVLLPIWNVREFEVGTRFHYLTKSRFGGSN